MKKILLLPFILLILSCSNDDDSKLINPNPEPNNKEIYKFSNSSIILEQKYYKGSDGNEYPLEADAFFKKQWSFYNDPSIKTIQLKNDSIIINENLSIQKFKYTNNENDILIKKGDKNIIIGHLDPTNKVLKFYKNYQTCLIIKDKNTNETFYKKESQFGKVAYKDIFPLLTQSPSDLTSKDEFIFWTNIEYSFKKE